VETLSERYAAIDPAALEDLARLRTFLFESFRDAHERMLVLSRDRNDGGYMATTLIAAMTVGESLLVAHVGDVRGYRHSADRLERITRDHSLVGDLVAAGVITAEDARYHPQRNLVTRALGLPETLDPSFVVTPLSEGDLVVLCTDGLWETLSHEEFAAILNAGAEPRTKADALLDRALAAGGRDNITVVIYEHALT
jgi:protein phosphatase